MESNVCGTKTEGLCAYIFLVLLEYLKHCSDEGDKSIS
jgi:hypothetical protein